MEDIASNTLDTAVNSGSMDSAIKSIYSLVTIFISASLYVLISFVAIEALVIMMYATIPFVRQIEALSKMVPDFIKDKIDNPEYKVKTMKKSTDPVERAEYILRKLEKETDERFIMLRNEFNKAYKYSDSYELLNIAASIELYYEEWLKKNEVDAKN